MLTEIFYEVDNFCKSLEKYTTEKGLTDGKKRRGPRCSLSTSEIMTIMIYFHQAAKRNFKDYYLTYIKGFLRQEFPTAPSYNRFIELIPRVLSSLYIFMSYYRLGAITGISFIDSTALEVCHPLRISSHKVFKNYAARGKTSTGWFYGFKLHIIINEVGEIIAFDITKGNVDDRNKNIINRLTKGIFGKMFGDRGYLSKSLFKHLLSRGIRLFTRLRSNMKNKLMALQDKLLLSKRGVIESVNNLLKNRCYIEHSRHRSPINFFANLISGLIAYSFLEKKPSINQRILKALPAL